MHNAGGEFDFIIATSGEYRLKAVSAEYHLPVNAALTLLRVPALREGESCSFIRAQLTLDVGALVGESKVTPRHCRHFDVYTLCAKAQSSK